MEYKYREDKVQLKKYWVQEDQVQVSLQRSTSTPKYTGTKISSTVVLKLKIHKITSIVKRQVHRELGPQVHLRRNLSTITTKYKYTKVHHH
jgi:hypothetical protein